MAFLKSCWKLVILAGLTAPALAVPVQLVSDGTFDTGTGWVPAGTNYSYMVAFDTDNFAILNSTASALDYIGTATWTGYIGSTSLSWTGQTTLRTRNDEHARDWVNISTGNSNTGSAGMSHIIGPGSQLQQLSFGTNLDPSTFSTLGWQDLAFIQSGSRTASFSELPASGSVLDNDSNIALSVPEPVITNILLSL
ncbi:MAG: hypothetical protein U0931_30135 [Vulcanimicrobiota bacterium]